MSLRESRSMHLPFGAAPTSHGTGSSAVAAASLMLHLLLAGGATAADLPLRHRAPAHRHAIIRRVVVAPPVVVDTTVLTPPPRTCAPGYSESAAGPCLRHGELRIACGREGRGCIPLPPDLMPYGLGPYLRLDY